ncbi:MAG: hypothetical protein CTY15_10320 [Methylocystis sp.]|nr:MAG: hypothetical protein CTY15_10320 [Methylocystis sp.]
MRDDAQMGVGALSRPLSAAEVPGDGLEVEVVATETERAALARLNALPAVHGLTAKLRVRRWRGDGLALEGELRAGIRQSCVLTLDEFDSTVVEPIEMRFAPPRDAAPARPRRGAPEKKPQEEALDPFGEDPPDPIVGGKVDLGAVVCEFFTLALDPYPRKPGAEFAEPDLGSGADAPSPFVKLRAPGGEPPAND